MSKALEMVFAEMTLKDLASKGLEKIGKASKAAAKGIDVVEKGLAAVNAASKKMKEPFQQGGRWQNVGAAMSGAKQRGDAIAAGAAGGSGFHTAIGMIPIFGGVMASLMTAMHATADQYRSGVEQWRQDALVHSNYNRSFKSTTDKEIATRKALDKSLRSGTRQKDFRASMNALSDMGVKGDTLAKYSGVLQEFKTSQGHDTLGGAVNALISGNIKQGAGISDQEIQVIKQAVSQLGQNGASADMMLRYVGGILNQNNARMVKNSALTKDLQNAVSASNEIQDKEEAFVRRGTKYSKEYSASFKVRQAEADLQGLAAGGASWAINKATGLIGKKRERGGPVRRGESYLVGERRPEMFTPGQSGTIIPRVPSGGSSNNITLNVYASDNAKSIAQAVRQELSTLFNTSLRLNMGLRMAN